MKLAAKELEVMATVWNNEHPISTSDIIELSPDRTWHEGSIFAIMKSLIRKGAIVLDSYRPTAGKHARVYKPIITTEDYAMEMIQGLREAGLDINYRKLADRLIKAKKG
jgi:predicted transcriptional regulator